MYKILCLRSYGISMIFLFIPMGDLFGSWTFHVIIFKSLFQFVYPNRISPKD
jgi:hypothetical protein